MVQTSCFLSPFYGVFLLVSYLLRFETFGASIIATCHLASMLESFLECFISVSKIICITVLASHSKIVGESVINVSSHIHLFLLFAISPNAPKLCEVRSIWPNEVNRKRPVLDDAATFYFRACGYFEQRLFRVRCALLKFRNRFFWLLYDSLESI